MAGIASNWKVLSGENNWDGLLDPIDDNLRHYLINNGFLTAAAPAALNDVKQSPGYALSRYPPENYFSEVGIEKGNPFKYQVTDFFYGRSEFDFGDWTIAGLSAYFGFVAVTTDEGKIVTGRRDIVVCWRGTSFTIEWFKDFDHIFTSGSDLFPDTDAKVHNGFHSVYTTSKSDSTYNKRSAREQVLAAVRRNVDKYAALKEDVSITITGHSLGSALATLNAMDIAFNGYNKPSGSDTGYPVTAFVFASPRVGNKEFQDVFNGLQDAGTLHLLRIRNYNDIVPELPPKILDFTYEDVGVELYLDTTKSPYIKGESITEAHDLNLYMHGVAGYQGNEDFKLVINLDIALLNKYNDLLKDSYGVPPNWWSNVFRQGMIQFDDGTWKLNDYVPDPPTDDDAATVATENGTK
ncbi:phospholipase A1-II 1 [Jatropha curcas]|uniref:phospholipase A1-II 1 n=1 Tax=Jatropha curcas TaxID=180498 RepID=UPI0018931E0E|nr:phospholipase A1-II 1 [Jatropha curcas]